MSLGGGVRGRRLRRTSSRASFHGPSAASTHDHRFHMPGMTGLRSDPLVAKAKPTLPTILLTAASDNATAPIDPRSGQVIVLQKPVRTES